MQKTKMRTFPFVFLANSFVSKKVQICKGRRHFRKKFIKRNVLKIDFYIRKHLSWIWFCLFLFSKKIQSPLINRIPFGIKNIHTYSEERIPNLRQGTELITFICPADWMMFQVPNGLDFTSLENRSNQEHHREARNDGRI